jgi:hypothetical protein
MSFKPETGNRKEERGLPAFLQESGILRIGGAKGDQG